MTNVKSFLIGTAAGAAIGAVTALLLAPKSGRELRKDIADGTAQAVEKTAEIAGQVGDTTVRIAKQVGSQTAEIADKAKVAAVQMTETVTNWRSKDTKADGAQEQTMSVVS